MKRKSLTMAIVSALFPVTYLSAGEDNGGGNNPGSSTPPSDNNTPNQSGSQSNPVLNPWAAVSQNPGNPGSAPPPGNNTNQPPADPSAQIDQYIQSLDLTGGADIGAMMSAVAGGDTEAFGQQMTKMMAGVYRQAVIDSMRVNKTNLEGMRDESVRAASANVNLNTAMDQLVSEIPAFGDESMQPVLSATLKGFMRQHNGDVRKSVESTRKYLQGFVEKVGGSLGFVPAPDNKGRPFAGMGGQNSPATPRDEQPDWKAFLGAVESNE